MALKGLELKPESSKREIKLEAVILRAPCLRMCARCEFLTHGIAVHFEHRAAASEVDAVAEEILTAERKTDTHRVLKRPGESTGVVLTVAVSPHRRIEHRG